MRRRITDSTRRRSHCHEAREVAARLLGGLMGETMCAASKCDHPGFHRENLRHLLEINKALAMTLDKIKR
ncbi:MAG: hypothetical protein AB7F75_13085 [Planctomycetota bacterium]